MGWIYGFPKKYGFFDLGNMSTTITAWNHMPLLSMKYKTIEKYNQNDFDQNMYRVMHKFSQPLLVKQGQRYRCLEFQCGFKTANIKPAKVDLLLSTTLSEELSGSYLIESLDREPFGGIYIETDWTMMTPRSCE